ncbi:ATP-binding protein [Sphingomonas sp.]|uniref:ATP-binding protein n=1 Tax=Sphingomonas sp. TaxID=28214 RepID=UPI0031DA7C16
MNRLGRFFGSLAGRIALLLAGGTMLAIAVSLFVAEKSRDVDFRRIQGERVLASATDVVARLKRDSDRTMGALAHDQIIGATLVRQSVPASAISHAPDSQQAERAAAIGATLARVTPTVCMKSNPFWRRERVAGFERLVPPDCWMLSVRVAGTPVIIALDLPPVPKPASSFAAPLFLLMMAASCIGLSLVAGRIATAPLRRLVAASHAFARSIDADPVPETGPIDVREALATFNVMQERVRSGLGERTRLLAAISHDLQTPLTRLRLRLENVEDATLRQRLVGDLAATLAMVRRGLELARGADSAEAWSVVDLDSLLSSMADDAVDAGHDVHFAHGCAARVRVKPDALSRCLGNLLDNAVKYGGRAEIACTKQQGEVRITIRDRGPGMEPELLTRAFEPFIRGDVGRATGEGTGIGLAIARAQAQAINATLTLTNHPGGGLEVVLVL